MTCPDFIEGFSRYVDGAASAPFRDEAERHLEACGTCRRYVEVYERGRELLRSFPDVQVDEDFRPRLRHRIYHIEDRQALDPGGATGSATTAVTALGMAMLLVLAAWSPLLTVDRPTVELSPIVVSTPESRPLGLRSDGVRLFPDGQEPALDRSRAGWGRSLLFQYSPLATRSARVQQVGLD